MDIKTDIRKLVIARRDEIPHEERQRKNALIGKRLVRHIAESCRRSAAEAPVSASSHFPASPSAGALDSPFFDTGFDSNQTAETLITEALAGKTIAVYQAMRSEPSLDYFIRKAYEAGARICFPCMTKFSSDDTGDKHAQGKMSSYMVFRMADEKHYEADTVPFTANPLKRYGIDDPEIRDFPLVQASDIDVVIVPMVAFDSEFNRLGYGGGNYDRFLPQLRENAIIVGVAFAEQEIEQVPIDEYDWKLPLIITA